MNPIASLAICNTASLNIYDIEHGIEDYVVVGMNDDRPIKHKIYYNMKGGYFHWGGRRFYLSEFELVRRSDCIE